MRLRSTADPRLHASFADAALGLGAGGGLWVPEALPRFEDWDALLALPFVERSIELLQRLIGDEFSRAEIEAMARAAFSFPAPLAEAMPGRFALELFHGPTLAFKDFGARFLAQVLGTLRTRGQAGRRTILAATSGDTGGAVASAFHGLDGFSVAVLYPAGRVSPLQERQFASLGSNVRAFAVEGSFDDCQALAKACFRDEELSARLGLSSANSINLARLLAQTLYYAEAAAQHQHLHREPATFSVPSGNFGDLCAGLYAQRMGLPIAGFIAATNANDTVPRHLETGRYEARPSVATLSSAMDVGDPSNWTRILDLFGGDLDALRSELRWTRVSDAATREAMQELRAAGYLADPHAAVAFAGLQGGPGVFLATAHPAKFREIWAELGVEVPLPEALRALEAKPVLSEPLPADVAALRSALLQQL